MEQMRNKNDSVLEDDKCIFTFEPIFKFKTSGNTIKMETKR